jgi:hypothetical protein
MRQQSLLSAGDAYSLPKGYVRLKVNGRYAVACEWASAAIRDLLAENTLHEWAAAQKDHVPMHGRGINYGVMLPAGKDPGATTAVVVRRNRHGGLLRSITGEYFRAPTRAPLELSNSLRLTVAGVNTPEVIAYAVYPVFMNLVRCDVVTRRLPEGGDFPEMWFKAASSGREAILTGVASLLKGLVKAGAWHADLNLKNIYVAAQGSGIVPYVLDVDCVSFPGCNDIAERNFNRLARSARKWRTKWGLDFDEKTLERLAALTLEMN